MNSLLNDDARRLYREILGRGGRVMFRESMQRAPDATRRLIDLGLLVHFGREESLTAVNPRAVAARPGGARPTRILRETLVRDRRSLAAGISLRTLYRPGVLTHRPTVSYAASATRAGECFRVLDEPFLRMLVFDRKVAVIPAAHGDSSAVFVEDPALVALLREHHGAESLFQLGWLMRGGS
ncbi:hypothetical protein [Kitasatospora phosalacinea]|uniref:hypothetical protein n=1 Tax=Kitasatospora phosalacinea TaxID=2065 RepID=UPI000527C4BD|nr:hypothetical protein [Kitasatospora phosalacinea]